MSLCKYCRDIFKAQIGTKLGTINQLHVFKPTFVLTRDTRQFGRTISSPTRSSTAHGKQGCAKSFPQKNQERSLHTSCKQCLFQTTCLTSSKTSRGSASAAVLGTEVDPSTQKTLLWQRHIYVQTSRDRWEDVPGGVFLDAAYLDSAPGGKYNPAVPVVVGLHSTPGNFYDLKPVLEAFVKSGCRVVAPAFPGLGYTEGVQKEYNDVFTHTTSEKAEFVRDFLLNLGIEKVDLLIAHGAAVYAAMRLAGGLDTATMFKSVALISPWPLQPFGSVTKKETFLMLLHSMWELPVYRPLARRLSWFVPTASKTGPTERITTVYTIQNINFSEAGGLALAMSTTNFPRVMFFAEDDNYIEPQLSYQLADMLGIESHNITKFSGQLEKGQFNKFPSCMVFSKGGHHLQQTQPGIITPVLFSLLKSVRPGFSL